MSEDICFEIFFEICFYFILHALWEIGIAVLMSMGMSEVVANVCLFSLVALAFFLAAAAHARKRKLLGKAVILDTDGDGYVSEEEWAAAGQDMDESTDEEEVSAPSSEDDAPESEKDGDWWEEEDEGK